jgi:hypothetical protein
MTDGSTPADRGDREFGLPRIERAEAMSLIYGRH